MGARVRPLEAAAVLSMLVLVGLHAAAPIACTDFFWHLKLGQVIATEGRIPSTDLFSAVWPDSAYVQPQWLWEWLAAFVYAHGGLSAVRLAQASVLVASFAGLYWVVRRITARGSAAYLTVCLAFLLFEDRFRARPDAMTLGFVALSLPVLFDVRAFAVWPRLLYVFGLALVWANMHGGASILLLLSLGALAVGAVLDQRLAGAERRGARPYLTLLAVAALGLVCSPTLIRGVSHWASLIGAQIQTGNEEWMPTYTALQQAVTPATLLIATGPLLVLLAYAWEQFAWTRAHGRQQGALGEWLLCGGYLALSQQAIRNVFLCIVPVVFMLQGRRNTAGSRLSPALVAASCLVAAITLHDVVDRSYGGIANAREVLSYDLMPDAFPEEVGDFLSAAQIQGGVFNDAKWGGYVAFRAWPRVHVFADSRQNFSHEMWQMYLATLSMHTRPAALEAAFRRWGVELALFRGPTFALGRAPARWQLLYKAGDQEVYQHLAGAHAAENVRRARAFLSVRGARPDEDLTRAATRIGAARFLSGRFQSQRMAAAQRAARSADPAASANAQVQLGETYYRAGLYTEALAALGEAQRLGNVGTRAVYLDAFCSYAVGDTLRLRGKLAELSQRDPAGLSRRQRERLALLRQAAGVP